MRACAPLPANTAGNNLWMLEQRVGTLSAPIGAAPEAALRSIAPVASNPIVGSAGDGLATEALATHAPVVSLHNALQETWVPLTLADCAEVDPYASVVLSSDPCGHDDSLALALEQTGRPILVDHGQLLVRKRIDERKPGAIGRDRRGIALQARGHATGQDDPQDQQEQQGPQHSIAIVEFLEWIIANAPQIVPLAREARA